MRLIFILIISSLLAGCVSSSRHAPAPVIAEELPVAMARSPAPAMVEESHAENRELDSAIDKPLNGHKSKPASNKKAIPTETIFNPTNIIEQLRYSAFGYSVPKKANIDDDIEVTMIVNPLSSTSEITSELPDGRKTTGEIQISRVIQAKLDSNDFIITPITPERQVIIGDRNTIWKWSLSAKKPGPNKVVKITVSAIVLVDGEKIESYVDTYTNVINIDITPKQRLFRWLSANWQWAWGALLIPVLGFFYNRKRKSK